MLLNLQALYLELFTDFTNYRSAKISPCKCWIPNMCNNPPGFNGFICVSKTYGVRPSKVWWHHLCIVSFESLTPSVNKIGPKTNISSTLPLTYFHSQKKLLITSLCFLPLKPLLILKKKTLSCNYLFLLIVFYEAIYQKHFENSSK